MMANVLATFAQFERRLISERTKSALAERRRRGGRLGRKPQIREELRATIRAMHASGQSTRRIARIFNEVGVPTVGGKKWQHSTVRRVIASSP
jgi:DNA invertase Pin-like site-specific DNA recombinase